MRLGLLAAIATTLISGCSTADDGSAIRSPSAGANPTQTTAPTPPESCSALADYLAHGGASHDDDYDATTDSLTVYSVDGREFRLTPQDAGCISGAVGVSKRVRDAVGASDAGAAGPGSSELLRAALAAGIRISVSTHCGVNSASVDGRLWLAAPPLGDHNPPPGWDENETEGYFIREGRHGVFYGEQGQRASFRRAPVGTKDPDLGCE